MKLQLVPETQSFSDPVGRPNVHQAALQQATGEAVYYDDIPSVQGELFVSMVTSTRAHAKIMQVEKKCVHYLFNNKFKQHNFDHFD